jgi:nitrite reductase/ring-hydroxylating ferredoxin subunit
LQLALVNVGSTFFALDNECTHRAGPLGEGLLVGEWSLQCPWHGAVFKVRTGEALEPPAPGPVRT